MKYRVVVLAFTFGLALSQPLAAAPVVAADKADIACLVALGKMRDKVLQDNLIDTKKQIAIQNIAQMSAFYVGKMVGRHPGETPASIARHIDLKSPEIYRLLDLSRCATEFKAALAVPGGAS